MKKIFQILPILALFLLSLPIAHAADLPSNLCSPASKCTNPGFDDYAGDCYVRINTVDDCTQTTKTGELLKPGMKWAFSCEAGCYQTSVPPENTCPGGIVVGGNCLTRLNVLNDTYHATNPAYKLYDNTGLAGLSELVRVGTAGCTDDQVPVSSAASSTGWKCANLTDVPGGGAGLWTKVANGSDIYYTAGKVGIGTSTPVAALDVKGSATIGLGNTASGFSSLSTGAMSVASGYSSAAMGFFATASGDYSTAMGYNTTAQPYASVVIGQYNVLAGDKLSWVLTDPLFVIGNGTSTSARTNALTVLKNGKVGIGTVAPAAKLEIKGTVIMGDSNSATGSNAIAMGSGTAATGNYAVAMGYYTTAQAYGSVVVGQNNVPNGNPTNPVMYDPLFVVGNGASSLSPSNALTVLRDGKVGIGTAVPLAALDVETSSAPAATIGKSTNSAIGNYAVALGNDTSATAESSVAMGSYTKAQAYNSLVIGRYNVVSGTDAWIDTEPLFVIGNGSADGSRSNAVTVLKNGKLGIGTATPGAMLDVEVSSGPAATIGSSTNSATGSYAVATGYGSKASGSYSTAMGEFSNASGSAAVALGYNSSALGNYSTAVGNTTTASGGNSVAMGGGTTASGVNTFAMGSGAKATGDYSAAIGYGITSQAYGSVVIGQYNVVGGDKTTWTLEDPVLVVANGQADNQRANALVVQKNGKVGIGSTGTIDYILEVAGSAGKTGGGSWSNSSDIRLKDIKGDYQKGLDSIDQLRPVTFRYKKDNPKDLPSDQDYIGFIAQEVQKVFPEAVTEDSESYLDFNMHPVNVAVINAIKELKAENEALRGALCELRPEAEVCEK